MEASTEFSHTCSHTGSSFFTTTTISVYELGVVVTHRMEGNGRCRTFYSVVFGEESLMTRLLRHVEESLCLRTEADLTRASVKLHPGLSSTHQPRYILLSCTLDLHGDISV